MVNAVLAARENEPVSFRSWLTSNWQTGLSGIVGSSGENAGPASIGAGLLQRLYRALIKAPDAIPTQDSARVATTLGALLAHHGAPPVIDYLSLDLEGHELPTLERFPFGRYVFRAMTLERPSAGLQALLRAHNCAPRLRPPPTAPPLPCVLTLPRPRRGTRLTSSATTPYDLRGCRLVRPPSGHGRRRRPRSAVGTRVDAAGGDQDGAAKELPQGRVRSRTDAE